MRMPTTSLEVAARIVLSQATVLVGTILHYRDVSFPILARVLSPFPILVI